MILTFLIMTTQIKANEQSNANAPAREEVAKTRKEQKQNFVCSFFLAVENYKHFALIWQ